MVFDVLGFNVMAFDANTVMVDATRRRLFNRSSFPDKTQKLIPAISRISSCVLSRNDDRLKRRLLVASTMTGLESKAITLKLNSSAAPSYLFSNAKNTFTLQK